jgi:hypothetical protein
MSWAPALQSLLIGFITVVVLVTVRPRRRNKRTGLPAPRPDERNSIEQFRRIIQ